MKGLKEFFSICVLIVLFTSCFLQSSITKQNPPIRLYTIDILELTDEDCYTYERVFINGEWWVYVYNCEGQLVEVYIETPE